MSKVVAESMKKEDNQMNSFENNNQDRFNRARGDFNPESNKEDLFIEHIISEYIEPSNL